MRAIKINMNKKPTTYRIILHKRSKNNKDNEQSRSITLKDYSKKSSIDNVKEQLIKFLDKIE